MFQVFSININALLDPDATLSFVTLLVALKFNMLPDVLNEIFSVSTLVDDSIISKKVYRVLSHFTLLDSV